MVNLALKSNPIYGLKSWRIGPEQIEVDSQWVYLDYTGGLPK